MLFGDLDAYLDKLSTCARAKEFGKQKLGADFYTKEHTKPIFNRLKLLTVQNLHKYHSVTELFKINPLNPKGSKRRNFFAIFCMCATFGLT